jgi:hypothetical protein
MGDLTRNNDAQLLLPDFGYLVGALVSGFNSRFRHHGVQVEVFETLRPVELQRQGYVNGRSKVDGVTRFSRHQFGGEGLAATVACDLVLRVDGKWSWASKHIPYYNALGRMATALGLQSGVDWDMDGVLVQHDPDESFYDGPHVQVPTREFRKIAQRMLRHLGYYSGKIDGIIGGWTTAALDCARNQEGRHYGISRIDPPTWNALVLSTPLASRSMYVPEVKP